MDTKACNYLKDIDIEKWTLAYDGVVRYGIETTNLYEVLNNIVKGAKNLPITALVEMTFYKLVAYFCKPREVAHDFVSDDVQFPKIVKDVFIHKQSRARWHRPMNFDNKNGVDQVMTRGGNNV